MYDALPSQQMTARGKKRAITCAQTMTLFSSVLATPSRVKLAHESGLSCNLAVYWRAAGRHAEVATLKAAHELGMHYTRTTMAGAAECNKLAEVQYLYRQGCKWPEGLLESASESGYFELERWWYEHGCPLEGTFANEATRRAAQSGNVARMASLLQLPGIELHEGIMCWAATLGHKDMCKYLHEQQCPWDM
jgi:hypothetical protein